MYFFLCFTRSVSFVFLFFFFFFNDTATTEIYTLSLHDALPIFPHQRFGRSAACPNRPDKERSEEHTSELQSQSNLVCRLLLEKKKKKENNTILYIKNNIIETHHIYIKTI